MAVTIQDTCASILNSIRKCNLNYSCQETPFSIYLTVRKSWSKHHQAHHEASHQVSEPLQHVLYEAKIKEIGSLKTELKELRNQLSESKNANKDLQVKVDAAAGEVLHHHEELKKVLNIKDDEVKALKNSIKNGVSENSRIATEVKSLKKSVKAREKEIYDLENFKINIQESVKTAKIKAKEHESEKIKVERQVKHLEKKLENLKKQQSRAESNNNISELKLSSISYLPSTTPKLVSITSSNTSSEKDQPNDHDSLSNPLRPSSTVQPNSLTVPRVSTCSSTPALIRTPPRSSSSLNTATPRPSSSLNTTPPSSSTSLITTPPRQNISLTKTQERSSSSQAYACKHTPQCVAREPNPPPPHKCSVLEHMGSMYHEHLLSGPHGLPARYGPHEDCMAIENRNYGCSDCVWYKRWGELHGLPDLYPWKYNNQV